jgi:hypothetical protein
MKSINPQAITTSVEGDLLRGQRHFAEICRAFFSQFDSGNKVMKTCEHILGVKWLHSSQVNNSDLDQIAAGKKSHMAPRVFIAIGRLNEAAASSEDLPAHLPSLADIQPILCADGQPAKAEDLWSAYVGRSVLTIQPLAKPDLATARIAEKIQRLSNEQRNQLFQLLEGSAA